jgi:hypothetical protein
MLKWILLGILILLVVMPRCGFLFNECSFDSDCDDDNPCTKDICDWTYVGSYPYEFSWCSSDYSYYCRHINECESRDTAGEPGICDAGDCGPAVDASAPIVDGGV